MTSPTIKAWLDDVRPVPGIRKDAGYVAFVDAESLLPYIEAGEVAAIDFDHDLGNGMTGYDLAKRIEELAATGKIPPITYYIHSGNISGATNIYMAMESAHRCWDR